MAVLRAAATGQITAEEIARRYAISPEELDTWSAITPTAGSTVFSKKNGQRGVEKAVEWDRPSKSALNHLSVPLSAQVDKFEAGRSRPCLASAFGVEIVAGLELGWR